MSLPSKQPIPFYSPYTFTLEDDYGESLVFSRAPNLGNTLSLSYDIDQGGPNNIKVTGNFHDASRQSSLNNLTRLRAMRLRSEQEQEEILFICPHPKIFVRGHITSLDSAWSTSPSPLFFSFNLDFVRSRIRHQPIAWGQIGPTIPAEGEEYFITVIPAGVTTLRDFALQFWDNRFDDGAKIRKMIELNKWSPADIRLLVPGSQVKVPL